MSTRNVSAVLSHPSIIHITGYSLNTIPTASLNHQFLFSVFSAGSIAGGNLIENGKVRNFKKGELEITRRTFMLPNLFLFHFKFNCFRLNTGLQVLQKL